MSDEITEATNPEFLRNTPYPVPVLTQVSARETHYHGPEACDKVHSPDPNEPNDPILLALERDQAWELMKYHERRASNAEIACRKEREYRRRMEIKAQALDRISKMIATSNFEYADLIAIIKEANRKVEELVEALNKKGAESD